MNKSEAELWARNVIERVEEGQPVEDSFVELKGEWPSADSRKDLYKWARQIAAHANSSRGGLILWLIGVDEKRGVIGADYEELANLWPQIEKHFDFWASPRRVFNLNLRTGDQKPVVALLLETDATPYVVNVVVEEGQRSAGVTKEVPWRDGNRTRSANRHELLKMLVPLTTLPHVEVLQGGVALLDQQRRFQATFILYFQIAAQPITIANRSCQIQLKLDGGETYHQLDRRVEFDHIPASKEGDAVLLITNTGAHFLRSGAVILFAEGEPVLTPEELDLLISGNNMSVRIAITPNGSERPLFLQLELEKDPRAQSMKKWVFDTGRAPKKRKPGKVFAL